MTKRSILFSALAAIALSISAVIAPAFADHNEENEEIATAAASETLFTGEWTKKKFKSAGAWSIVREGDKTYVKLDADFKTRKAPDLKLFLSPLAAIQTNGKNATDGAVLVAPLANNAGAQTYEIPAGVDLALFKSILIHCEQYAKLWSAADLNREEA